MIRPVIALLLAASLAAAGCVPVVIGGAAAGGAMAASDRRPTETQLADQRIEFQAGKRIGDLSKGQAHINVTSFNRTVLITGEAVNDAMKADIERTAREVSEVKTIQNEVTIGPPAAFSARSNDAYLTSLVVGRFVNDNKFNPLHVKVVTEASTVYLMGLVTEKEAASAANIARHVSGVKKVVRLFEIIPEPPPEEAAAANTAKPASGKP